MHSSDICNKKSHILEGKPKAEMLERKPLNLGSVIYANRDSKDLPVPVQLVTTQNEGNHKYLVTSTEDDKLLAKQNPSGGRGETAEG